MISPSGVKPDLRMTMRDGSSSWTLFIAKNIFALWLLAPVSLLSDQRMTEGCER